MLTTIAAAVSTAIMQMAAASRGPSPNNVFRYFRLSSSMALLLLPVAMPLFVNTSCGGSTISDDEEFDAFHRLSRGGQCALYADA